MSLRTPSSESRIAQRYAVEAEVARGGMGVVYKVRDLSTGVVRALKRIRLDAGARADVYRAAFEREYQVLASLDHPGIVRVYDYGVDGEGPYYTMEYVQGRELRELAPLPFRDACRVLRDVASALSLLHARRLLHRDLSPKNVKLNAAGRPVLLDFGALSDFGYPRWVAGTPPLVAPEALAGGMLDQRVDLYAVGALAYWLLTGTHAYPAEHLDELPRYWKGVPRAPSAFVAGIPGALDALTLSLLSANLLARPASAAEVIAHLNGIAELPPEPEGERERLARSFLATPSFVGRDEQLGVIAECLRTLRDGRGAALRVMGPSGSGRTRLLEEAGVRAQLCGACVVRVDASMHASAHGTSRALAQRMFEAQPELSRQHAVRHAGALAMLGSDLGGLNLHDSGVSALDDAAQRDVDLAGWFLEISREKPLVLQVDNAEYADDVSLGLLVALASRARTHPLVLMVVERSDPSAQRAMGLRVLESLSRALALPNLSAEETLAQVRAMFGDAPNLKRFAQWLYQQSAGSPLLGVELARQLVDTGAARYEGGMWLLPMRRPEASVSTVIDDVLSSRLDGLSAAARALAQCLSLQRIEASFELCVRVSEGADERTVLGLLDELAQHDVVQREQGGYRFSSSALREVVLASMDLHARVQSHLRLGRALEALSGGKDPVLCVEAGWHLIRGGQALEGAERIAAVMGEPVLARRLNANLHRIGAAVEAALHVYRRSRRTRTERMPLLAALAHAGYFEDATWEERYGDDALDILDGLSGMRLARRLRFLGRPLALLLGLSVARVRFALIPRRERPYSFFSVLIQLFGSVITMAGLAALRLDGERVSRVAGLLEPFSCLPGFTTAAGVHRFCSALQAIPREHQARAYKEFQLLAGRFADNDCFRMLPPDVRPLFLGAASYAYGGFAIFREDGSGTDDAIEGLERAKLRLYTMIASQLRFLYYANRGELALAAPHRAAVELHAAHAGSAWQVEIWEAAALLPLYLSLEDATAVAQLAHRLDELARSVPSLLRYARLARLATSAARGELERVIEQGERELAEAEPRGYIGWSAAVAVLAGAYNERGKHARAREVCEVALSRMSDEDRDYVSLFLRVDLEAAIADAGLGAVDGALARLDALIARFGVGSHRLALGLLHEARARIAWRAQRLALYEQSLAEVERWFAGSETPSLVAKCERLRELQRPADTLRGRRAERVPG